MWSLPEPLPGPSYDLASTLARSDVARLGLEALDEYYEGTQRLSFISPRTRADLSNLRPLVINLPRLVVDSIEDRLDVEGFRLPGTEAADEELWRIWQANGLDQWSQQCHLDALVHGRSYVCVWAGADERTPRITVESARQMSVEYDPSTRTVVRAVKQWADDGLQYATIYATDFVTRYSAPKGTPQRSANWRMRSEPVPNVMGVVPVVPFVNRPRTTRPQGQSEMVDVIPLTDAIIKLATDMMISAEAHAMPRRWATGVELGGSQAEADRTSAKITQTWENADAKKVWLAQESTAQFGQFREADLSNYVQAMDSLTVRAAALAGLPPHYFGQVGENPASADALRASEAPLVKRALRKQRVFGEAWEHVMRLAVLVRDGSVADEYSEMETVWRNPETPTVAQKADAAVKLLTAGAIDREQVQEDLGYTPVQIERMADRASAAAVADVQAKVDYAGRLMAEQGLSQNAALAAAGLTIAAGLNT